MSDETSASNALKMCGLCDEKASKYCCPRCDVLYCSLDCYKSRKHANCSESFYRDCVNDELASYQADDESRRKMIDILKRMRNEDESPDQLEHLLESMDNVDNEEADSDDNDEFDLHDRIKDLNLDDADALWNVLTEDEKNDFESILNQGDVGAILPQWEPWWMYQKKENLVQDVTNVNTREEDALKKCPVLKNMPKLTTLTNIQPHPAIKFNIINVLASYAFVTRYFNGEPAPLEGTTYLLNICANLDANANFDDAATALQSVGQKCIQSDLIQTDKVSLDVMQDDTLSILQGPSEENKLYYCKAALSQLHTMFLEAKSATKLPTTEEKCRDKGDFSRKFPQHKNDHLPKLDVSKVKKCLKKVEYFLSFIESYGLELE